MLPSKVQNQVSLMKIAIKQAELIEDMNFTPLEGDKEAFNALRQATLESYADTMKMLGENLFEIATANY